MADVRGEIRWVSAIYFYRMVIIAQAQKIIIAFQFLISFSLGSFLEQGVTQDNQLTIKNRIAFSTILFLKIDYRHQYVS